MCARRLCFTRKRAPHAPHAPHQIARVGSGACRGSGDGDGGGGGGDPVAGLAKGSPRWAVRGADGRPGGHGRGVAGRDVGEPRGD
jgi:hypothetical protein